MDEVASVNRIDSEAFKVHCDVLRALKVERTIASPPFSSLDTAQNPRALPLSAHAKIVSNAGCLERSRKPFRSIDFRLYSLQIHPIDHPETRRRMLPGVRSKVQRYCWIARQIQGGCWESIVLWPSHRSKGIALAQAPDPGSHRCELVE